MDEKLKDKKVSAISLGCDKNRVDLEKMLFKLSDYGFKIVDDVNDANIVIVNTCAFITPAKKEALENIFDVCLLKAKGKVEKVIVTGCLPERHKTQLEKEIKEVDAFLNLKDNDRICEIIEDLYKAGHEQPKSKKGRIFTSRGSYAYLKIADGCSNGCSFCTIPRIRGRYISYPMEDIVEEAKYLASNNIKELILVAQDVSRYGEDLYKENRLIQLLDKLSKIKGIEWIRLHYIYPEKTTNELLSYIDSNKKMCKYVDIPLQHIDNNILRSMNRRLDEEKTRSLIHLIKNRYPSIHIRSTFIVGYPTETNKEFKKLCDFVKESKFDYAGFFPYYREENTASYYIKRQNSEWTKKRRLKKVKKLQAEVAYSRARMHLGKSYKTLVDYFDDSTGLFIGHTEFLSPTVDFNVKIVDNGNIKVGDFVMVKFLSFDGADYKGEVYEPSK
ncbi:MAG TPA: 30S ribosomal protein S12 methylthiotransferase RimO [Candidatus Caccovivens faecavium]|nr:30S ribosomal protein S12 methylthiotransferase RimO [Candidatus Caccovivens faecavium]